MRLKTATKSAHEGLLNKDQLAAKIGLSRRGIECLVARRKIPVLKVSHRCVRFDWEKVKAALAKFEIKAV